MSSRPRPKGYLKDSYEYLVIREGTPDILSVQVFNRYTDAARFAGQHAEAIVVSRDWYNEHFSHPTPVNLNVSTP
jgi:hypothetical protein